MARSLSRLQIPTAAIIAELSVNILFMLVIKARRGDIDVLDISMRLHAFCLKEHIKTPQTHLCPDRIKQINSIINTRNIQSVKDVCM